MKKVLVVCIFAYFHTSTFANAAEFNASVWRGETAYVEIPKAFQDKAVERTSAPWRMEKCSMKKRKRSMNNVSFLVCILHVAK